MHSVPLNGTIAGKRMDEDAVGTLLVVQAAHVRRRQSALVLLCVAQAAG
ncbi:MAG: hypothetical protein IJ131_04190 [Eggerthellaceae bacterium]|nr:hypothetical protein [Eggerthellaceae bacterium]